MQLQIDAVHEPVNAKLLLRQVAREATVDLITKLRDAVGDEGGVEFVITIHRNLLQPACLP